MMKKEKKNVRMDAMRKEELVLMEQNDIIILSDEESDSGRR